ncbi:NAD(P)-binding protein [Mycolicibacterium sp. 3033]|nr:NAD(P)-binding protein [Mycolicibacterium aurantiacum]
MPVPRVAVIGAGLSGAACAQALRERGISVEIMERGRGPGGRMASPNVRDRRVDLGAAYFTVKEPTFRTVVDDWARRGLARPWTDTFEVLSPNERGGTSGPVRYAAAGGLRSLVDDLLSEPVRYTTPIESLDELPHDAVVLAMPDPQAARLVTAPPGGWVTYDPVIAVAAGWPQRSWALTDAAFVNDDPDLSFLADDGSRRGDGAAVLVAHSSSGLARRHLENPERVVAPVVAAMRRLLAITGEPDWTHVHRWTFAKPAGTHGDAGFHLDTTGRPVGLCGDSWCPSGAPRVEAAWLSGQRLGAALAAHLTEGNA